MLNLNSIGRAFPPPSAVDPLVPLPLPVWPLSVELFAHVFFQKASFRIGSPEIDVPLASLCHEGLWVLPAVFYRGKRREAAEGGKEVGERGFWARLGMGVRLVVERVGTSWLFCGLPLSFSRAFI